MDPDSPQSVKIAAIIQIVSGFLSWVMVMVSGCLIGTVCGTLSCGFGGQFCGIASFLLIPIGIVEIGIGVYSLTSPREAYKYQQLVAYAEIGALLLGGLTTAIAGVAVTVLLRQEEAVAYIEG